MSVLIQQDHVENHFNGLASEYEAWKEKSSYYYHYVMEGLKAYIPPGRRVLEIGCATGAILDSLKPSFGLGIDLSEGMIQVAKSKRPHLNFAVADIAHLELKESFDHVVMVDLAEHLADLPGALRQLGRLFASRYDAGVLVGQPAWAPVLDTAEKFGLKMPEGDHVWPSAEKLESLAADAGLKMVSLDRRFIIPKRIPWISDYVNAHFPHRGWLSRLNLIQILVFKRRSV